MTKNKNNAEQTKVRKSQSSGLLIRLEILPFLNNRSKEDCGILLMALLHYIAGTPITETIPDSLRHVYELMRTLTDHDLNRYNERCAVNRINALQRSLRSREALQVAPNESP